MIIKMFVIFMFFSLSQSQNRFMPNLPLGEYRTVFDRVYPCESTKTHPIQINIYLSKKTSNTAEIKGNLTTLIPFDDTLTLDINFESWSLTGGWKPNSAVYITKNACTNTKRVIGNAWLSLVEALNVSNSCPIPAGTYTTLGIDLKELENHNFPKVYFYGKYKAIFKLKNDKNKLVGCVTYELQLIRPWEKPM